MGMCSLHRIHAMLLDVDDCFPMEWVLKTAVTKNEIITVAKKLNFQN